MSDKFDFAYKFTKKWEGGWSNVKDDPGGATNYGITLASLRDFARRGPIFLKSIGLPTDVSVKVLRDMTPSQATEIFRRFYWEVYETEQFPRNTAAFIFDCTVNHGHGNAVKLAQRGINNSGVAKLSVDSVLGPKTSEALFAAADSVAFIKACCDAREKFFRDIVAGKSSQRKFLNGWLARVDDQRTYLGIRG